MNDMYVNSFVNAAEEFKNVYGRIADNYMNNESTAETQRENFVNRNDQLMDNELSPLDNEISEKRAANAKHDTDIASHQREIRQLENGTHPALQEYSDSIDRENAAKTLIAGFNERIQIANEDKKTNEDRIAELQSKREEAIKNNVGREHDYDAAFLESEKNYRQELVDAIKKFKGSFNEVDLPGGTKASNVTMIQTEIQRKLTEIVFNRAIAIAEMEKLPQHDPRKGEYGRAIATLTEQYNGLVTFSAGINSFLGIEKMVNKKYVEGMNYPDVVEMQRTFEKMNELMKDINNNRIHFDKEVPVVTPADLEPTKVNDQSVTQSNGTAAPAPDNKKPDTTASATSDEPDKPDDKKPDDKKPDDKKPDAPAPDGKNPDAAAPDGKKTDDKKPDVVEPDNKQTDLSSDRPGINFDKTKTKSLEAKNVIGGRRLRNGLIAGGFATAALLSTIPIFGVPAATSLLIGGTGVGIDLYATVVDYARKHAFDRKMNNFAKTFGTDIAFDYEKQNMYFTYTNEKGEIKRVSNYAEMENRLIDQLKEEGLSPKEIEKEVTSISKKQQHIFKKLNNMDVKEMDLSTELGKVYDKFGGITEKTSIPAQMNDQIKRVYNEKKEKFKKFIDNSFKYHLSPAQLDRIQKDYDKLDEMDKKNDSKLSKVTQAMGDLKDKIANSRVVQFFKDNGEDFYEDEEDLDNDLATDDVYDTPPYDIVSQDDDKTNDVGNTAAEPDGNPAEPEPKKDDLGNDVNPTGDQNNGDNGNSDNGATDSQEDDKTNDVGNTAAEPDSNPVEPATEEDDLANDQDDSMYFEDDLMYEAGNLANEDDVIKNDATKAINGQTSDFDTYRNSIDEQIQYYDMIGQTDMADNLRNQLEQMESQNDFTQDMNDGPGLGR